MRDTIIKTFYYLPNYDLFILELLPLQAFAFFRFVKAV